MGNGVRRITEKYIPYCLHGCTSGLDVVVKRVILPSDIHHKSWDKSATPDMMIDFLRKVSSLEFFVAIRHFGFLFNNECLVQMLDATIHIIMNTYLAI
jgi:hypothetical protein